MICHKNTTVVLGGKSANVVFDDADIESAVNGVVSGIFAATGQDLRRRIQAHRSQEDRSRSPEQGR